MPSAEIFAIVADSTADLVAIRHKRANLSAAHNWCSYACLPDHQAVYAKIPPGCFKVSTALANSSLSTAHFISHLREFSRLDPRCKRASFSGWFHCGFGGHSAQKSKSFAHS
jgi:hypothetical protein